MFLAYLLEHNQKEGTSSNLPFIKTALNDSPNSLKVGICLKNIQTLHKTLLETKLTCTLSSHHKMNFFIDPFPNFDMLQLNFPCVKVILVAQFIDNTKVFFYIDDSKQNSIKDEISVKFKMKILPLNEFHNLLNFHIKSYFQYFIINIWSS